MKLLAKFDAKDYSDATSVLERYCVRGIIRRNGKIAMQYGDGEYKIPGGGQEPGETYLDTLAREIHEETGFCIKPERTRELGEIVELRRDIFVPTQQYICHSLFFYCEIEETQDDLQLTSSEIEKGYELRWSVPEEIYRCNHAAAHDPWILRDTAFIKMLLDRTVILPD